MNVYDGKAKLQRERYKNEADTLRKPEIKNHTSRDWGRRKRKNRRD